jgi:hypothetical protein
MREQGAYMQTRPDVYAPVLALTNNGYVMPTLQPLEAAHVQPAMEKLKLLWQVPNEVPLHYDTLKERERYHTYVMQVKAHLTLLKIADSLYSKIADIRGTTANTVHGDATLENCVVLGRTMPVWLDPNLRPVPLEVELDVGKLLQSYYGYHELPSDACKQEIGSFLFDLNIIAEVAKYYFVTHLVRLWPYQLARQAWAVDAAVDTIKAVF